MKRVSPMSWVGPFSSIGTVWFRNWTSILTKCPVYDQYSPHVKTDQSQVLNNTQNAFLNQSN